MGLVIEPINLGKVWPNTAPQTTSSYSESDRAC